MVYTRNFETKGHSEKQGVPVQSFDDSFSADAFLKSEHVLHNQHIENKEKSQSNNDTSADSNSISFDEVLLIGLVILLLSEKDKKENAMLPILLSLLLL